MTQQAQSRARGNVSLAPAVWSDFFTAFRNHIAVADPVQEQPALDPVRAAQFFALGNHMLTTFSASGQAIPMWEHIANF